MDTVDISQFLLAFVLVLGLIGVFALALKRYGHMTRTLLNTKHADGRLHIVETHYLDPKRRLVLIRRDHTEHLLLLADGRELLIETNIASNIAEPKNDNAQ